MKIVDDIVVGALLLAGYLVLPSVFAAVVYFTVKYFGGV